MWQLNGAQASSKNIWSEIRKDNVNFQLVMQVSYAELQPSPLFTDSELKAIGKIRLQTLKFQTVSIILAQPELCHV